MTYPSALAPASSSHVFEGVPSEELKRLAARGARAVTFARFELRDVVTAYPRAERGGVLSKAVISVSDEKSRSTSRP